MESPADKNINTPYSFDEMRVLRGLIAGGVMGGLESLIMYPSIFLKTQLQLDYGRSFFGYKWASIALGQVGASDILRKYKGPVDCIRKTYAARGLAGFYTGCVMTVTASVPKVGVRFATTETILGSMQMDKPGIHALEQVMFAGSIAAIIETLLIGAPMETVMTQIIKDTRSAKPKLRGAVQTFGEIVINHGFAGLYRGTMSIMGRQIFSQLARLLFVETARDAYQLKNPGQNLPIVMVAGLGAASGVISVLFTAPIDLIKTRMQGLFWNKYRSPWQCARKLWVKEGPQVFFRGSAPRMVRVCIDMAYSATFYEFMCNYMEETWVEGAKR